MANILVVDDEIGICKLLSLFLEERGHTCEYCLSGKEAVNLILLFEPEMIISDIKMSPVNGIELLHWVKANYRPVPFVFITGFSDILLFQEAINLGAFSLIKKPFTEEEIIEVIGLALGDDIKVRGKGQRDDDFCKIDLSKFISGSIACCSIYVKIREGHFVKLAEKNDPLPKEKLVEYQEKNLQFLYVLKEEFGELVGFNMRVAQAVSNNPKIPKSKVLNFINYSNGIIMEQAFVKSLDNYVLDEVVTYSKMVLDILCKKNALYEMLVNLGESSRFLYSHSISTAIISYLIAKKVGWKSEPTLCRVYVAGLLHDIGLKDFSEGLLEKNINLLNDFEYKEYLNHPKNGMEILNGLDGVPEEVILAAYQHHECCDGSGYPQGILKNKISPISRLVAVADILDKHPNGNRTLSLRDFQNLIMQIERTDMKKYDPLFFNGLKEVFKITT